MSSQNNSCHDYRVQKYRNRDSTQTGICHTQTHTLALSLSQLPVPGSGSRLRFGFGSGRVSLPLPLPLSFPFSAATRALYLVSSLSSGGSSSRLQNAMVITYIIYHTHTMPESMYSQLVARIICSSLCLSLALFGSGYCLYFKDDGVFHH